MKGQYTVTKEQQIKELTNRIPPIVNVDIIIKKENSYLIGMKADGKYLFPGGRMKYTESPQETALRILKEEAPGITASVKKVLTVQSDKGWDKRAYGVTIYFLLEYLSGEPEKTDRINNLKWISSEEFANADNIAVIEQSLAREIDIAARTINITEEELIVEVDKENKEIGEISRRDAHRDNTRFHRAAFIFIFTSGGKIVLQKRSLNKVQDPGVWDMAGGHQSAGQTIEQCAKAELLEEMGITTELTLKRIGLWKDKHQSEYYYVYYGIHNGPYGYDKNEVEAVSAFDCEKLLKDKPKEIYPHIFDFIEEFRDIWEPLTKTKDRNCEK